MRPDLNRVPEFYHNYIKQVPEDDLMTSFKNQTPLFIDFLKNIPVDKIDYAYAPGKWTIKQILQHLIDGERVFCYRSLCFARKDPTPLPPFDENIFAENAKTEQRDWHELVEEFKTVRKGTEYLFGSFDDEQLNADGISNKHSNYVLGFGFITISHCMH